MSLGYFPVRFPKSPKFFGSLSEGRGWGHSGNGRRGRVAKQAALPATIKLSFREITLAPLKLAGQDRIEGGSAMAPMVAGLRLSLYTLHGGSRALEQGGDGTNALTIFE